jgi:transposase
LRDNYWGTSASSDQHSLLNGRAGRSDLLDAGVKLRYLPPYSTDLNPIEEFSLS